MATPTAHSKPTPRGPTSVATPNASSPCNLPPHASHVKAAKSPHRPNAGGTASTTHTPFPASSPAALDSFLHGLGRARAGTLGASQGKPTPSDVGTPGGGPGSGPATHTLAGLGLGLGLGMNNASGFGADQNMAMIGTEIGVRSTEAVERRTRDILLLLSSRWGRVSQDGLVACIPRLRLDGMWEDGMGSGPGIGDRRRTYVIAGTAFSVEVEWVGEKVKGVMVDFTGAKKSQKEGLRRAGEILRRDLIGWDGEGEKGYVGLERFAANMERLARLDRLGESKVSCFEALDGLYNSLVRLWEWEVSQIKEHFGASASQKVVELEAMSQRSGRPAMHEGRDIGHRIDYWLERRAAAPKSCPPDAASKSVSTTTADPFLRFSQCDKLYSLILECEAATPSPFTSIRVAEEWIASDIGKKAPADPSSPSELPPFVLNWLNPNPTLLSIDDNSDAMDLDATIRQSLASPHPPIRFVARLDPPVTLPLTTANEMHQLLGVQLDIQPFRSYTALLFPEHPEVKASVAAATAAEQMNPGAQHQVPHDGELKFRRVIRTPTIDGGTKKRVATYTLFSPPDLLGRTLTEIPFSHPNQLMVVIPYLRQWAYFGGMLRRSVGMRIDKRNTQDSIKKNTKDGANSASGSKRTALPLPHRRKKPSPPPTDLDDIPSDTDSEVSRPDEPSASDRTSALENISPSDIDSDSDSHPDEDTNMEDADANLVNDPKELPPVDLWLAYSPNRRIELDIAPLYGECRARLTVSANAKVELETDDASGAEVGDEEAEKDEEKKQEDATRVLRVCEDLGMVGAWLKANE